MSHYSPDPVDGLTSEQQCREHRVGPGVHLPSKEMDLNFSTCWHRILESTEKLQPQAFWTSLPCASISSFNSSLSTNASNTWIKQCCLGLTHDWNWMIKCGRVRGCGMAMYATFFPSGLHDKTIKGQVTSINIYVKVRTIDRANMSLSPQPLWLWK